MKILFTGATHRQVSDTSKKLVKRIDDSTIICNSLRSNGFQVDRKIFEPNEDLSEYGLVIVGIGQLGSFVSRYAINALCAVASHPNVILFFEDWRIKECISNIKTFNRKSDEDALRVFRKVVSNLQIYPIAHDPNFDISLLRRGMARVLSGECPALVPGFAWGDKNIIKKILNVQTLYSIDLTPYVLENWNIPLEVQQKDKQKRHMLASLSDQSKWISKHVSKWDVQLYGGKHERLDSETAVFHRCGDFWSILCPEYPHAGCGWFRARWIYGALWKSIVYSSPKDSAALGIPHVNPENLNDTELQEYANLQSDAVLSHMITKETFDETLKNIVLERCPDLTIGERQLCNGLLDFM